MTIPRQFALGFWFFVGAALAPAVAHGYEIDASRVTTSGLSSGAYMAGQLLVAYSSRIHGAGLIAGGPYDCAQNQLGNALTRCMNDDNELPPVSDLVTFAQESCRAGWLDPIDSLVSARLFIFSGEKDDVVSRAVVTSSERFFEGLGMPASAIETVTDIPVGHALPTTGYGNACATPLEPPYLSQCGYDAAGILLAQIDPGIRSPRGIALAEHYFELPQGAFTGEVAASISLGSVAVAYVPAACSAGAPCGIHVMFHGCEQPLDGPGAELIQHGGYNEWAESNRLIVLYPQAVADIFLGNPKGCWDWWGYSSPVYQTREAPQLRAVMAMITKLSEPDFRLNNPWRSP